MFESLVVYLSLFAVMALCGVVAARREPAYVPYSGVYAENKRFLEPEIVILIGAFTFVFGCRWGVGIDFFHYLNYYLKTYTFSEGFEFLFQGISSLFLKLGFHYAVFFGFWAGVQITLLYAAFKKYRFLFPYIAFFLIFGSYYLSMMNVIRQQVAALVFLYSIQFIENRKIVPYYICVILAFFIHRSAILLVVVYPLFRLKDEWFKSTLLQLIVFFICLFLSSNQSVINEWIEIPFRWFSDLLDYDEYGYGVLSIEEYNDRTQFGRNSGLAVYANLIRYVPIILVSKGMKKYFNSSFFNMIYSMWFVCISFGLLFSHSIVLYRPFVFVLDTQFIVSAFFAYYCFKSKKSFLWITAVVILLLHLALFINVVSNGAVNTSQFVFFWQS